MLEGLSNLIKVIFSTPFFIVLFGFMVFTIIVFSVYGATKNKLSKIFLTISYFLILLYLFIEYGTLIITLCDLFTNKIFLAIHFPNLITYVCMVVVASLLMIVTVISKKFKGFIRVCNVLLFTTIMLLFLFTIDIISKNNISLFDNTAIYLNPTLMLLIQSSMSVFSCFLGLLIINLVINLINVDVSSNILEVFPKSEEIIQYKDSEDVKCMTEEDYYQGYTFYKNKKQNQEYINYDEY